MDRRRKRIIAFLQQEGGRAGRPRCAAAAATIGIRSGGKVDSVLSPPSSLVLRPLSRNSLACLEVGRWGWIGEEGERPSGDPAATVRLLFAEPSISDRCSLVHGGSPLPPSPRSLGPLLLLRPFQSLRVDVKIAPSPLELAPMEPIGRPDDELRLREGGEVYR